ncbi:MAG: hypothetical protein ACLPY3_20075 [Solirubrobacteraceae bacterium]
MTLFNADSGPEHSLLSVLDAVDPHHGEYSHARPLSTIEVFGTEPTGAIHEALATLGFAEIKSTDEGFVVDRLESRRGRSCCRSIEGAVSRVGSAGGESAACSWKEKRRLGLLPGCPLANGKPRTRGPQPDR